MVVGIREPSGGDGAEDDSVGLSRLSDRPLSDSHGIIGGRLRQSRPRLPARSAYVGAERPYHSLRKLYHALPPLQRWYHCK